MLVFLRPRLLRRAAFACLAAAFGYAPLSALALMPWSGEGPCSALVSAGNVAWHCDFRDYRTGAMDDIDADVADVGPHQGNGALVLDALSDIVAPCDPSPDLPSEETLATDPTTARPLPYDWQAGAACGPTDWEDEHSALPATGSVTEAIGAVVELVPVRALAPFAWGDLWDAASDVVKRSQDLTQPAAAQAGTRVGAEVAARTVAGQMSGVLGAVGRQFLGAAAALDRVAAEPRQQELDLPPTARQSWLPQPCMEPYGHLGL
jgi:hypothetical protein